VKREVPLFLTAVIGLFMILSFFVPHHFVSVPADFLQTCAIIVVAFSKREPGWGYKVVLVVSLLVTIAIGILDGMRQHGSFPGEGSQSKWIYDNLYSTMSATMFALLAFFIASAAFRAFRIRTFEAGLLAVAALIVMLGRVPVGDVMTHWLPEPLRLGTLQQWIMDFPQNAAKRAILIGAALGVMATGLRVILGIERSYLSGED
jgi:hypothetical protein